MELQHSFTVPASRAETWAALNDIESVAGCFPGATVTAVEGDTFTGSCKVKLGPIALVYNGTGTFVELDEEAGTMRIEARGKDKRGNGTAGADVIATLTETDGGTTVEVLTDLNVTGKPAQFGRGVMQDVSDKLLGQFVECLQGKVGAPAEERAPAAATESPGEESAASPAEQAAGSAPEASPGRHAASSPSAASPSGSPPLGSAPPGSPSPGSPPAAERGDDSLDLGAAVLPVLLKSYGKQLAGALAVLALLLWWRRRRR